MRYINGNNGMVSIERLSIASRVDELLPTTLNTGSRTNMDFEKQIVADEYVVEKNVGRSINDRQTMYRVRWYWYSDKDDTAEPADNIPKHFIRAY